MEGRREQRRLSSPKNFLNTDIKQIEALLSTPQYARYAIQKTLAECRRLSGAILKRAYKSPAAEAYLWVELEGVFDSAAEHTATELGILRVDENQRTVSDLHGIQNWSLVRGAIRSGVLLHILRSIEAR